MKLYKDLVTGRIVRINRHLTTEERQCFLAAANIILEDPSPNEDVNSLAREWLTLDETAVELVNSDFRNMSQLQEVDGYGDPIATEQEEL